MRKSGKRVTLFIAAVVLGASALTSVLPAQKVQAAQITNRSLTLLAGSGGDGGSKPGGVVNHSFLFNLPTTAGNLGSVRFEYCTTATGVSCVAPTGLSVTAATLGSSTGAVFTSLVKPTANTAYVSRTPATHSSGNNPVTVQLNSVTNPYIDNTPANASITFFVRITSFASTDTTGSPVDTGTVTASTTNQIQLTGIMPESLIFCAGGNIDNNVGGIPDCSTATSGAVTFNQLFSPTDTATAISEMAASTNGTTGYNITVAGSTLSSGANTIPTMATTTTSQKGVGQFGMNLRANTTAASNPAVGADITVASNGTDLKGQPTANYGTADSFRYVTTESVANSAQGGPGPTNAQIYTASYIVNVTGSQPAGTYTSTLTYVCTATF